MIANKILSNGIFMQSWLFK